MRVVTLGAQAFSLMEYDFRGKYEGGLQIDQLVDNTELFDEQDGNVDTTGHYGLIRGPLTDDTLQQSEIDLTPDEREFLKTMAGAIVHTDSQGFVDVSYYATDNELQRAWEQVTQEIEDFHASAHAEAYSETDLAHERTRDLYSEG